MSKKDKTFDMEDFFREVEKREIKKKMKKEEKKNDRRSKKCHE